MERQHVPSAAQRKNRKRAGVPLDSFYCARCHRYHPPALFTLDLRPQPYVCDACVERMIDVTQRETQTTT